MPKARPIQGTLACQIYYCVTSAASLTVDILVRRNMYHGSRTVVNCCEIDPFRLEILDDFIGKNRRPHVP